MKKKKERTNCIGKFKWLYILRELLNLLEITIFVTESQLDPLILLNRSFLIYFYKIQVTKIQIAMKSCINDQDYV